MSRFFTLSDSEMTVLATIMQLRSDIDLRNRMATDLANLISSHYHEGDNKNLAIANRSCVSCAHNTFRASIGPNITP